jgi:hypothetical protein
LAAVGAGQDLKVHQGCNFGFVQPHHDLVPDEEGRNSRQAPAQKIFPSGPVLVDIPLLEGDALLAKVHLRCLAMGSGLGGKHDDLLHHRAPFL